jgi:FkbM family methyltransferase
VRFLNKPEYLLRPHQVLARIRFAFSRPEEVVDVRLPWGLVIGVRPDEEIGRAVCTYGLYDLVTSETIVRLLDPGETALDIGANLGYMTGLMAWRSGPRGRVHSFEPCSQVLGDLCANTKRWAGEPGLAPTEVHQLALSRSCGYADLHIPASFGNNQGTASLEAVPSDGPAVRVEQIETARLDEVLGEEVEVGLAKIDVEGHELAVLEGAAGLLANHRIRDIVFEEHGQYPTPVQRLLQSCGYTLYRLSRNFLRPLLLPPGESMSWDQHPIGVLPNFLATLNPARAQLRFSAARWRTL